MRPTAPFRLRRVIGGVLVGLVVLFLAAFGWVGYQTALYHRHENAVVAKYRDEFKTCLAVGGVRASCASQVSARCVDDVFWSRRKPFNFGLGNEIDDAAALCRLS
ncbi:MAG TPA: hypothetical protein VHS54_00240 [Jatrophihabitans sp.]|nr:hypothetical protein [Jatrophihabitans sp.]